MARPLASEESRESRRNALLDAAIDLWLEHPERLASVAEVAKSANVAKGTIYLYFRSKEDLLLAAHERHVQSFFNALIERANQPEIMNLDDMMKLTLCHIVEVPAFLPLATLVAGMLHKGVTPEIAQAFEQRMSDRLSSAGTLLCRHFKLPDTLHGVRLLMQSYALILGLWQLIGSENSICTSEEVAAMLHPTYSIELDDALRSLWRGMLNKDGHDA